ncbi:LptF/LptG family permease [Desulfatiferula olefinivorans]
MKLDSIINRYIFRSMIPPFLINLGFLSFIFLLAQILEITNLVVNYNVSLTSLFLLVVYSMPEFLKFTIPMSVMMGVLLTFLKMASDKEIIAVKAGGCSIYHLTAPVILFCFLGFSMAFFMSVYGFAWGKFEYNRLVHAVMAKGADAAIKERVFNDTVPGVVFYVNQVDVKNKQMNEVFIEDSRNEKNKSTVVAPRARRYTNPDNPDSFTLRLYDGMIVKVDPDELSVNTIRFDTYDVTIPIEKTASPAPGDKKAQDEMTVAELKAYIRADDLTEEKRNAAVMELHEKFSIPFACFTLGLLAMPMGLKSAFSRKSSGLGLGLVCFLGYYALMGFGWSGGKSGLFPPVFGMWMPNIIMGGFGLYMLLRTAKEKPIGLEFIANYYRAFRTSK